MKLSELMKVWDIVHVMDVGDLGFCDLDAAITTVCGPIENDIPGCQPKTPDTKEDYQNVNQHLKVKISVLCDAIEELMGSSNIKGDAFCMLNNIRKLSAVE